MSRDDPNKATTAIGYSIVVNLDGNRQVTAQCFVAEDESDAEINARFDRVFGLLDRQKARYDVVNERVELTKEQATFDQLKEDLAHVDANFDKAQAVLDEQIIEMQAKSKETFEDGYNEHVNSGRRGEYVPKGLAQQTARAIEGAVAKAAEDKQKNVNEREQHRTGVMISVERYEKAIEARKAKIAEYEGLLG